MLKKHTHHSARFHWLGFLLVQIAFITAVAAAAAYRMDRLDARLELPAMRYEPLVVLPLYDDPRIITDEQLEAVLYQLRPQLRHERPKINHVDHALRFWGVEATFADSECLSGAEMRQLLVDHGTFAQYWGEDASPLLITGADGVAVRTREGLATASHVDHTLGTLAELGTPLEFPIHTPQGEATLRDLLEHSLRDFSLNQVEYEWSAVAYASYLPPTNHWYTKEGQRVSFDDLAGRLMRQRLNQGVCMGNHRLHSLVLLTRIDDQVQILSEDMRKRILDHLLDATNRYVQSQYTDGYWLRSWPAGEKAHDLVEEGDDTLTNRLLATGHVMEWWALAPEEVHPPREVMVRAGQWLARTVNDLDESTIQENYTYLTHVGRALALWRGRFPHQFLDPNGHIAIQE